ncbi:hypothetical protein BHE74_00024287 [Ensete ventricosum]|nr:hypothetical protein BHE74_00024287 [Ensete ventricosum]
MQLGTRLEYVWSLPMVLGACEDGAREFAGRLSGVAEKLVGSLDDVVGVHREFARTSPKVSRRLLGTHREITGGRS